MRMLKGEEINEAILDVLYLYITMLHVNCILSALVFVFLFVQMFFFNQ